MSSAYRSAYDHIVGLKQEEVREAREELEPLLPRLREVTQARVARIAAGAAGVVGAIAMCWYAATTDSGAATYALVFGTLALAGTWALVRAVLAGAGRFARVAPEPELTGDLDRDLALIGDSDVRWQVRALEARADKLETASIALPFAGLTFLLPLFLHWLFGVSVLRESVESYAQWIRISLVVVGHAHIGLAVLGYLFARKLHRSSSATLASLRVHHEWAKIWLITIGISSVPGIVFLLVPPILVAITGVAFIPFMVTSLYRAVVRERFELARAVPEHVRIEEEEADPLARVDLSLTEEQEREDDRDDEHAGADAGDRAQA